MGVTGSTSRFKMTSALHLAAIIIFTLAVTTSANKHSRVCAKICAKEFFNGACKDLPEMSERQSVPTGWIDKLKSVRVSYGCTFKGYKSEQPNEEPLTITKDTQELPAEYLPPTGVSSWICQCTRALIPECAQKDVIYSGANIVVQPGTLSAHDCGILCETSTRCRYWTYYLPRPGVTSELYRPETCILKASHGGERPEKGFFSGPRGCKDKTRADPPVCAEKDVLYDGADIEIEKGVTNIQDCGKTCRWKTNCLYWSFYQPTRHTNHTQYKFYDCVHISTLGDTKKHRGFWSGDRGCF